MNADPRNRTPPEEPDLGQKQAEKEKDTFDEEETQEQETDDTNDELEPMEDGSD
jgi:hypothetical protein